MSKNFGIETSFTLNRKTAKPGYISSTQYGIVTGTHAVFIKDTVAAPNLYALPRVGRAVYLHDFSVDDGCGEVSIIDSPEQTPFGVLAMSHVYSPKGGYYTNGDIANIITFGCVYMICSSNMEFDKIHFGKQVGIVGSWGSVVNIDNEKMNPANTIRTRWYFTGAVEFGVHDERFGTVNVAEVMVVPGSAVDQHSGDWVPEYYGHKLSNVTPPDWYGVGGVLLLPPSNTGAERTKFDFFVNVAKTLSKRLDDAGLSIGDVKKVVFKSYDNIRDYTKPLDARTWIGTQSHPANTEIDISDGVGLFSGTFESSRTIPGNKEPSWCAAVYTFNVTMNDDSVRVEKFDFIVNYEM